VEVDRSIAAQRQENARLEALTDRAQRAWIKVALVDFLFLTPKEDRMRSATISMCRDEAHSVWLAFGYLQTEWGIRQ
jgi:uncharacterized protein YecT (DUF1311 family)